MMSVDATEPRVSLPKLPPSEISFCVAIIPTSPLREQVVAASVAISHSYDNDKLIDDKPFPAHISLHLGGTKQEYISELGKELQQVVEPYLESKITAQRLYMNSGGFIAIQCDISPEMATLVKSVLEVCGNVQRKDPTCRPHILEKWSRLRPEQQKAIYDYGTYKNMAEDQHLSIAQVARYEVDDAFQLAKRKLILPQTANVGSIAFAEIGHRNEKWNVFAEWSS